MLAHVEAFDFSIFSALPPLRLLDEHAQTRWYVARFGSGLPPRPPIPAPPATPASEEAVCRRSSRRLRWARRRRIGSIADLVGLEVLAEHFERRPDRVL